MVQDKMSSVDLTYTGQMNGTIHSADGSDWSWEVTPLSDYRLMFRINGPDKTSRTAVAPAHLTVPDVRRLIERIVERKTRN
jgi:hypothetical protein